MADILVIDDDPGSCQLVVIALKRIGHRVTALTDSVKAVQLYAEENHFDLVITDIFMPDQDGLGVIMEIRKNKPKAKIIAISGGGDLVKKDFLKLAQQLGAAAVLRKPCSPDEIRLTVAQVLSDKN